MKTEMSVMLGTGEQYQDHYVSEPVDEKGETYNYATIHCWTIHYEFTALIFGDDEDYPILRLSGHRSPTEDSGEGQPPVTLYLSRNEWEELVIMADREWKKWDRSSLPPTGPSGPAGVSQ